jgi:hypothetical protein
VAERTNIEKRLAGTFFLAQTHQTPHDWPLFEILAYQLASNFPVSGRTINVSPSCPYRLRQVSLRRSCISALSGGFSSDFMSVRLLRLSSPLISKSLLTFYIPLLGQALREPDRSSRGLHVAYKSLRRAHSQSHADRRDAPAHVRNTS